MERQRNPSQGTRNEDVNFKCKLQLRNPENSQMQIT